MRTQEEIVERFKTSYDMFHLQQSDLLDFLDFEHAKEFLKEEYIQDIKSGKKNWSKERTDSKDLIINYLPYAYKVADENDALKNKRCILHFKTWIWFDNDEFYNEILENLIEEDNFKEILDKISNFYQHD